MSTPEPRPPWLARRWMRWAERRLGTPELVDDANELFARRARRDGPVSARRWYRRQARGSVVRLLIHGWEVLVREIEGVVRRLRLPISWIDVKLGVRMLGKQPFLTVVAGLALGIGIPASLVPAHVMGIFAASFPVDDGDRVLGIRNWDQELNRPNNRLLHEYWVWREELTSFETIGAARLEARNVHSDGRAEELRGAEVSASVFPMLRVVPLLGRPLLETDEVVGAPRVVLLSENLWESRFARDPNVIGKTINVGSQSHSVVGVMPAGFHFPMAEVFWIPLRARPGDYSVGGGPELLVFGRLADAVSWSEAEAQIRTVGRRLASEWPGTHERLRPEVVTIGALALGEPAQGITLDSDLFLAELLCLALLAIACGNVGVLLFARTAMRLGEISIRSALGASRLRILVQLFVESFVLAVVATGVGLVVSQRLTEAVERDALSVVPYWFDVGLSPRSIVLALGLASACAVLAGVLPAIRVTNAGVQASLQRHAMGGALRFGAVSTVLIVAEVALSVGFMSFSAAAVTTFAGDRTNQAEMDIDRYVVASFRTRRVDPLESQVETHSEDFRGRVAVNNREMRDRLRADADVVAVAMAETVPGEPHRDETIEVEGGIRGEAADRPVALRATVHVDFFDDLGLEILEGRGFSAVDVAGGNRTDRTAVVVNEQFVASFLGAGPAVGRRIRYAARPDQEPDAWLEVVGVVETFGMNVADPKRGAGLYHPAAAGDIHPMRYLIQVEGEPRAFLPRLREIGLSVDADATLQQVEGLRERVTRSQVENRVTSFVFLAISFVGTLLAATGLYALLSFTVVQRRREIGIRAALGAGARRVILTLARRAALQLAAGIGLGALLGWWILSLVADDIEFAVDNVPGLLLIVAVGVAVFSAAACLRPLVVGLRIEPTEALKEG